MGTTNRDPGAYGPTLIDRFKPLVERKMEINEQALEVAVEFIQIVARCFGSQRRSFTTPRYGGVETMGDLRYAKTYGRLWVPHTMIGVIAFSPGGIFLAGGGYERTIKKL